MSKSHRTPRNAGLAHALELIEEASTPGGVHLDLDAGLATIAEKIQALGHTYVAVGEEGSVLADLRKRGFETHAIDLANAGELQLLLEKIRGQRELSSISMIGAIEKLADDRALLGALRRAIQGAPVALILDAANLAHTERALGLVAGRWDGAAARHTAVSLDALLRLTGWRETGRCDQLQSPDGEPRKHSVALSSHTQLNQFLRKLHQGSDESASVIRFVRAYLPATRGASSMISASERPFLSAVMRTQGRRPGNLRDVLLALASQSSDDFEVILLPHKVDAKQLVAIEAIVAEQPEPLRQKIRVVPVAHGGRTAPLNVGFAHARGEYISVLDDDDMVFAHWVETFKRGAAQGAGTLLRAIAVEQEIEARDWSNGEAGYRTLSGFKKTFPADYDLYAHLTQNYSPPVCLAFPAAFFHELGEQFDEELNTCEDWDYEMRCALTCGVTALREYTAIYRMWKSGQSSYTVHPPDEWQENDRKIVARLNGQPRLFPAGTVELIRKQQSWIRKLEGDIVNLQKQLHGEIAVERPPVPPPGSDRPVRYDIADELNRVFKRIPAVHPLLKASLRKLKR